MVVVPLPHRTGLVFQLSHRRSRPRRSSHDLPVEIPVTARSGSHNVGTVGPESLLAAGDEGEPTWEDAEWQ